MRLCLVSHASGRYGAEAALVELILALRSRAELECLVLIPRPGPLEQLLNQHAIPYQVVPYRWWVDGRRSPHRRLGKLAWNIGVTPMLIAAIRRFRADLVITNTICVVSGAVAARVLGLPHVWHVHELDEVDHGVGFDLGRRVSRRVMRRLTRLLLVNSQMVAETYRDLFPPDRLRVVYQSVSVDEGQPPDLPAGGFRCAIVGFLQPQKGQHEAVAAVAELLAAGIDARLWIVGSGDAAYEDRLRRQVQQAGLGDRVTLTGFVDNPFPLLQAMDAVLVCGRLEAFGRVTVEALLAGRPVVGCDSGCTPELLADGRGLLYPPGHVQRLAEQLRWVHDHPQEARDMGQRGQAWARTQFTRERYGEQVAAALDRLQVSP